MSDKNHSLFAISDKIKVILGAILVAVIGLYVFRGGEIIPSDDNDNPKTENRDRDPSPDQVDARDLRYQGKELRITRHAKCRMGCREIDAYEVDEVIRNGKINQRKSNPNDSPCPTYAIESKTRDGQTVRVVVAECDREARLVTVIDLKNNYQCHCD